MQTAAGEIDAQTDVYPAISEGWELAKVKDTLELKYGRGLRKDVRAAGLVPVYGSNGLVGLHDKPLTGGPTIIVGRKGTVGAVHFSPQPCWPIDTTYYIDSFRGLDPNYLTYALRSLDLGQLDTSTAIPGLNRNDVYDQNILIPPLEEQRRIAVELDRLLAACEECLRRLIRVGGILKRFRQSVLAAACSGRLTEDWRERNCQNFGSPTSPPGTQHDAEVKDVPDLPEFWVKKKISDLGEVQGGIQKQPVRLPVNHHFPYLRVANVLRGKLNLSEIHRMELFSGELERYRLRPNDLLIVEGNGSLTEIGRCAVWQGEVDNCVHQNHIIRVRITKASPQFVARYWNSPLGIADISSVAVTTAGLYSLSTKKVANTYVPLPPDSEQQEIVRRVKALFELADTIQQRVSAATARVDELTQAILAKAFRGELVPTEAEMAKSEGQEYEPGSALIGRTRVERSEESSSGRRTEKRKSKLPQPPLFALGE